MLTAHFDLADLHEPDNDSWSSCSVTANVAGCRLTSSCNVTATMAVRAVV